MEKDIKDSLVDSLTAFIITGIEQYELKKSIKSINKIIISLSNVKKIVAEEMDKYDNIAIKRALIATFLQLAVKGVDSEFLKSALDTDYTKIDALIKNINEGEKKKDV